MSDISRLKHDILAKLDIKNFYEIYLNKLGVPVRNFTCGSDGWSTKVICPFHADQRTPNFAFNIENGGYQCFACSNKGSLFDFWCLANGLDKKLGFKTAIEHLCGDVGINPPVWGRDADDSVAPTDITSTPKPAAGFKLINKAEQADKANAPIKKSVSDAFHAALTPEHFKYLNTKRGLKAQTIKDYNIGWDDSKSCSYQTPEGEWRHGRFTIPVCDRNDLIRNIRKYGKDALPEYKMLNTKPFGSPARLFPLNRLHQKNWEHVVICEGEWDTILLNQEFERIGLGELWGAVTGTAGVNTFEPEWLEHLYGRNVYLCFDVDQPGLSAAASHCSKFFLEPLKAGRFRSLKIIRLPLDGSKEMNDISDYFLKAGNTIDDLVKLFLTSPAVEAGGIDNDDASVSAQSVDNFVNCVKDRRYIDKRIQVPLAINGQTTRTYHACRSYRVVACPLLEKGVCCNTDSGEKILPYGNDIFIQSCMANKVNLNRAIQEMACTANKPCTIEIVQKVVMEEYYASQVVTRWRAEENQEGRMENIQQLVSIPVYILQPEHSIDIKAQNYLATGWIRSHPNTQHATLFIEHMEPLEEDWISFNVKNEGVLDELKKLQELDVDDILQQVTDGVTQIYESDHILLTILLTYLSPLKILFNNQVIRGWINSCVIGDSGTGKSKTYERISDWIQLGDLFSVLTGKRTGLLYAVKQKGNEWYVGIGRYVMANKKIIAIDETQEMLAEEIKKMAIAMDTGMLEVSQVSSGRYQTEVRTIFLMNPRVGKTLSDYTYGCQALRDCFDPMFIRRLDIAIFCTGRDNFEFYNRANKERKKNINITADMFKHLIYWAWTRTINDIHWSPEAEAQVFVKAIELSDKYGQADDIPLIAPTDIRLNIARLATAYAILDCNFTEDYEGVNIDVKHVDVVTGFIDQMYSDVSCNLAMYSKVSGKKKTLQDYDKIKDNFERYIRHNRNASDINQDYALNNYFCQFLLILQQNEFIRKNDLREQIGLSSRWVQRHINILQMYNLIEISQGGYKTTRKFNIFMQRWMQDDIQLDNDQAIRTRVDHMMEQVHIKIGESALQGGVSEEFINESIRNTNTNGNYQQQRQQEIANRYGDPFV